MPRAGSSGLKRLGEDSDPNRHGDEEDQRSALDRMSDVLFGDTEA